MNYQVHDLVYVFKEGRIARVTAFANGYVTVDSGKTYSLNEIVLIYSAGGIPEKEWEQLNYIALIQQILDVLLAQQARRQTILFLIQELLVQLSKLRKGDEDISRTIVKNLADACHRLSGICNLCLLAIDEIDSIFPKLDSQFLLDYPGIGPACQALAGQRAIIEATPTKLNDLFPKGAGFDPK